MRLRSGGYIVCLFITVTILLCLMGCSNKAIQKDEIISLKAEGILE